MTNPLQFRVYHRITPDQQYGEALIWKYGEALIWNLFPDCFQMVAIVDFDNYEEATMSLALEVALEDVFQRTRNKDRQWTENPGVRASSHDGNGYRSTNQGDVIEDVLGESFYVVGSLGYNAFKPKKFPPKDLEVVSVNGVWNPHHAHQFIPATTLGIGYNYQNAYYRSLEDVAEAKRGAVKRQVAVILGSGYADMLNGNKAQSEKLISLLEQLHTKDKQ